MSKFYDGGYFVDENGKPYGVKHIGNKPRVSSMPYLFDIAEGNIANHFVVNKFGHNNSVGGTYETIWSGSNIYPYMTTADQLEVLSDDANDDDGDAGARTVKIEGLDSNWDEINDTVTMNGTGVVTTTKSFLRVFRAQVVTAGATLINEGTITIRDQDTDTTRAMIEPNVGQSLMATWTVPDGHTFFMTSWYISSAISKVIDIGIFVRNNLVTNASFQAKRFKVFTENTFHYPIESPDKYTERTDIEVRAFAGGAGGDISAGFSGWYEL